MNGVLRCVVFVEVVEINFGNGKKHHGLDVDLGSYIVKNHNV